MKKRAVVTLGKYALGLFTLALLVLWNWESTDERPGLDLALEMPIALVPLILAAVIFVASVFITFLRWYVLVRSQNLVLSLAHVIRLGLMGFFFSVILPGALGGDIVKAAFIAKTQSRRTIAVATVIVDRFAGLCGLLCVTTMVSGSVWIGDLMGELTRNASEEKYLRLTFLIAFGVFGIGIALWYGAGFVANDRAEQLACWFQHLPKVGGMLAELLRALHIYRQKGKSVAIALVLSVIGHLGFVLSFYFAVQVLTPVDQLPTLLAHFFVVPAATVAAAGFPSPGGLGGKELAISTLYQMIGFSGLAGVLGCLVQRAIGWVVGLLGYFIILLTNPTSLRNGTCG